MTMGMEQGCVGSLETTVWWKARSWYPGITRQSWWKWDRNTNNYIMKTVRGILAPSLCCKVIRIKESSNWQGLWAVALENTVMTHSGVGHGMHRHPSADPVEDQTLLSFSFALLESTGDCMCLTRGWSCPTWKGSWTKNKTFWGTHIE